MNKREEKMRQVSDEIKKLKKIKDELILEYDKKIELKNSQLDKIKKVGIFEKEICYSVIASLVSKIDGEEMTFQYDYKYPYYRGIYKSVYLKPVNAKSNVYPFLLSMECDSTEVIDFSANCVFPDVIGNVCYPWIVSPNHSYVLDFMHYVMDYRLNKLNYDICEEEFRQLAVLFVSKYMENKNSKTLEKKY